MWPEFWSGMSNTTQRQEKPWAIEKPKFDNATKARSICLIDPEDIEFKKNHEKKKTNAEKLELPLESAHALQGPRTTSAGMLAAKNPTRRSRCACIVETHESTSKRLEQNSA